MSNTLLEYISMTFHKKDILVKLDDSAVPNAIVEGILHGVLDDAVILRKKEPKNNTGEIMTFSEEIVIPLSRIMYIALAKEIPPAKAEI